MSSVALLAMMNGDTTLFDEAGTARSAAVTCDGQSFRKSRRRRASFDVAKVTSASRATHVAITTTTTLMNEQKAAKCKRPHDTAE